MCFFALDATDCINDLKLTILYSYVCANNTLILHHLINDKVIKPQIVETVWKILLLNNKFNFNELKQFPKKNIVVADYM